MQFQTIPLSQLKPHPRNVRKTGGTSISDLAASIAAHGLLHPLVVSPMGDGFEVVAGARRLAAMKLLAENEALPAQLAVGIPCTVMAAGSVTELSLAENVIRQAMHPADEFDAFRALVEDGQTIEAVAARFGVKVRHVQERLRLANVAPELLDVYRAGGMTLDQVMALSVVDNHAAQIEVWGDEHTQSWERQPDRLRDSLLSREITTDDAIADFVGLDAYSAAGGTVREDLFSDVVVLEDSALVNRLANAKLKAKADELLADGWGWVHATPEWPWSERAQYKQLDGNKPSPLLGAVVTISAKGGFEIHRGLLKPGQKAPAGAKTKTEKASSPTKNPMADVQLKLEGVRLGVVRSTLRAQPEMALAVLVAMMWADYAGVHGELANAFGGLDLTRYRNPVVKEIIDAVDSDGKKAAALWHEKAEAGTKKHGSLLAWLIADGHSCMGLLEFLSIEAVDIDPYSDEDRTRVHQALYLLGVNLADHWQLTPEWLQAQGKAYILAALEEALGKAKLADGGWAALKPAVLPEQAHKALVAAGWLPEPMRQPEVKKPAAKSRGKAA